MDDITEKISDILSDEESVKQLTELAQMLMSDLSSDGGNSTDEKKTEKSSAPDMGTVMKLSSLAGAFSQNDKNTELISALRPHLSEERRSRADKALKILKIMAVYKTAKDNGLLNDLI